MTLDVLSFPHNVPASVNGRRTNSSKNDCSSHTEREPSARSSGAAYSCRVSMGSTCKPPSAVVATACCTFGMPESTIFNCCGVKSPESSRMVHLDVEHRGLGGVVAEQGALGIGEPDRR